MQAIVMTNGNTGVSDVIIGNHHDLCVFCWSQGRCAPSTPSVCLGRARLVVRADREDRAVPRVAAELAAEVGLVEQRREATRGERRVVRARAVREGRGHRREHDLRPVRGEDRAHGEDGNGRGLGRRARARAAARLARLPSP